MKNYKLNARAGSNFDDVSMESKLIATKENVTVEFDFNGVKCLVNKNTDLKFLSRDYSNSWTMGWKTVGPDCVGKYSSKVQDELEIKTKERDKKRAKEHEEYVQKQAKERKLFEAKVKGVKIELSDVDGWNESRKSNTDPYGKAALGYAEGWAKLMQVEMSKGKTLIECAEKTSYELNFMGITGFMYGCAVSILSQTWKHGEELRKWHNKEYGVGEDKKGVVNPAILTIG